MRRPVSLLAVGVLLLAAACSDGAQDAAGDGASPASSPGAGYSVQAQPDGAAAVFASPDPASNVSSPVSLELNVEGVDLAPAGTPAVGEGHVHVIVDSGCVDTGEPIPGPGDAARSDGVHHFGDGASSGRIELEPGGHELCVQLGDGAHRAFGQTDEILITVEQ